jgi:multiple sugar transport system permease protein
MIKRAAADICLSLIGIIFLIPMLWLVVASFNPKATFSVTDLGFSLSNFKKVFTWDISGRPIMNSFIISFFSSVIIIVVTILASYPLSRFHSKVSSASLNTLLFASCLPMTSLMIPVYSLFTQLHLLDSTIGVILFMSASGLPMGIFMMKNFMDSIPVTLEEAAWVDGASRLQTLWKVVVPLMKPSIIVIFIYEFAGAWGNFFVPFMLLMSPDKEPAAVGIYLFFGQYGQVGYGQLAAFAIYYSLPVMIVYLITERSIGSGSLLAGSVKG